MFSALLPLIDNDTAAAATGALVTIILLIAHGVIFVAALVSVLSSKRYTGGGKFLWVLVVFAYPLFGALGWFIAGRKAQIIRAAA